MSPRISTCLLQTQSDERLAAAAAAGHERAFEALVQRYRRRLLRYCRQLGLPEARAEDALQQALMKAWISLQRGAEVRDVSAWLYRIVHNAAVDAHRGAGAAHEQLSDAAEEIPGARANPEHAFAMRETLAGVAALPALQREALLCTAVEGYSNEQAALALGLSGGAVRGLVYRARVTLRAAASAITPPAVLTWAEQAGRRSASLAERLGSVGAGGGTAGVAASALLKGGAVVLTAGAIFAGAATIRHVYGTVAGGSAAGAPRVSIISAAQGRRGVGALVLAPASRRVNSTGAGDRAPGQTSSGQASPRSEPGSSGSRGGAIKSIGNGASGAGGSAGGHSPQASPGAPSQPAGTSASRQEAIVMGAAVGGAGQASGAQAPGETAGNGGGPGGTSGSGGAEHRGDDGGEGSEGGEGGGKGGEDTEGEDGGKGGEGAGKEREGAGKEGGGSSGGEGSKGEEEHEGDRKRESSSEGEGREGEREGAGDSTDSSKPDGARAETGESPSPD